MGHREDGQTRKKKVGEKHVRLTDTNGKEVSPCSAVNMVMPGVILCPACKEESKIWPDEKEAVCHACGTRVEKTSL